MRLFDLLLRLPLCSLVVPRDPNNGDLNEKNNRRMVLRKLAVAVGGLGVSQISVPQPAFGAETVGKDSDCTDRLCLGVWDGLLADCPHGLGLNAGAGCTSSQDDTPGIFSEP
jgi:hypothetical protein